MYTGGHSKIALAGIEKCMFGLLLKGTNKLKDVHILREKFFHYLGFTPTLVAGESEVLTLDPPDHNDIAFGAMLRAWIEISAYVSLLRQAKRGKHQISNVHVSDDDNLWNQITGQPPRQRSKCLLRLNQWSKCWPNL